MFESEGGKHNIFRHFPNIVSMHLYSFGCFMCLGGSCKKSFTMNNFMHSPENTRIRRTVIFPRRKCTEKTVNLIISFGNFHPSWPSFPKIYGVLFWDVWTYFMASFKFCKILYDEKLYWAPQDLVIFDFYQSAREYLLTKMQHLVFCSFAVFRRTGDT